ncbi:EthD family reductase [Mesorhizobium qingshengii]|nr:EthD family reductase [Mesorhizobium qingshengii]
MLTPAGRERMAACQYHEAQAQSLVPRKTPPLSKSAPPERHWCGADEHRGADHTIGSTTMAKMLVIYKTPADPAAFDRHYFDIHLPLAKQLPGLRRYDVSKRPIVSLSPGEIPYIVATLYFDSLDAIRAAFASEIGKACAVDRRKYAPEDDDVMMLLFDSEAM